MVRLRVLPAVFSISPATSVTCSSWSACCDNIGSRFSKSQRDRPAYSRGAAEHDRKPARETEEFR